MQPYTVVCDYQKEERQIVYQNTFKLTDWALPGSLFFAFLMLVCGSRIYNQLRMQPNISFCKLISVLLSTIILLCCFCFLTLG